MPETIAQFENVTRVYDRHIAVNNISFSLPQTGVVGLLGLNGAGKTTTMFLLCGIVSPNLGQVFVGGFNLKTNPKSCKALIGFAPDRPPIYPDCTVFEYLNYCAKLRGIETQKIPAAIELAMQRVGIEHNADSLCQQLSHGYRQRLNLAQAIVHTPPLIVLDEPTSGLDPAQIESVRALLRELSQNSCVLISTHLLFEAQNLCQRIMIVHQGQLLENTETEQTADTHRLSLSFDLQNQTIDQIVHTLKDCPIIEHLEEPSENECCLKIKDTDSAHQDLLAFIVKHKLPLMEMQFDKPSLEKRFLALTQTRSSHTAHDIAHDATSSTSADESHESAPPAEETRPESPTAP